MNNKKFALIDCNNFYASCERIFNPELIGKPIIVLSNNDGCVIARSNEAKILGISMGDPYHKVKNICNRCGVRVFSSNYTFYGDMSSRVMACLSNFTPNMEIYSIDEAFLDLSGFSNKDLHDYALEIRKITGKWTGIPVSIGIAPTKTLAKLANFAAKKFARDNVCNLISPAMKEYILRLVDIEDVWGVGRKWSTKMRSYGIKTAFDLKEANPKFIRKNFSVIGEKILNELNSISCLDLEAVKSRKNIMSTRSFGSVITEKKYLEEAVANYVARAGIKLREQNSYTRAIYVYIRSNPFSKNEKFIYKSSVKHFEIPTNKTSEMITAAKETLSKIYVKGHKYKKAGIMLLDLIDQNLIQDDMYCARDKRGEKLINTIDNLNKKNGRNTVSYAAQGIKKHWFMKSDYASPKYTTSFNDLPKVS